MAYLTFAQWRSRSIMPPDESDDLLSNWGPEYFDGKLAEHTSWINARLRKRYATPFSDPVPEIVLSWLERLVTFDVYLRRGFNPSSQQDEEIKNRMVDAKAEIKEAADSNEGLYDLPLREDSSATGISKGGPWAEYDNTPYGFLDAQRQGVADGKW